MASRPGNERLAGDLQGAPIAAAAGRATFVHLATHGYFAPESVRSAADRGPATGEQTASGLSPLVLTGLALSGANLPPDALGRRAGVRRAGQGYASLRAALLGADARFVLTSLWKVGDEATMALMVDFYRRLWVEKQEPHAALWQAKMAARTRGAAFRDWAGWLLTGR